MSEEIQNQQFSTDNDPVLRYAPQSAVEDWPQMDRRELDIIQALAAADFSPESRVRQSLKRKLLNTPTGEKEYRMNPPLYQRSFVRLALAGILIAFLLLAVSPLGATLAQSVIQTLKSWQLGENTTAVSVEGDFEAVQAEDGSTVLQPAPESPEIEEENISIRPQRTVVLDPTIPFDLAQERVNFTLRQPTFVPEGYEFVGVVMINSSQASLDYFNEPEIRLFGLLQTAVGGENSGVQISFSSDMIVKDVHVNGHEAVWISAPDEGLLVWEADGVNYQLAGLSSLSLALQVAESIQ
jgi:hypothetical protein